MKKLFLNILRSFFPKTYLNLKLNQIIRKPSDINEHLSTLSKYASECNSILETGVRKVVSSWALLHGLSKNKSKNKKLILNDIFEAETWSIEKISNLLNIEFSFIKGSNLEVNFGEISNIDMIFIDTFHVYGQLKRELRKFAPITKKFIVLHDTTIDGEFGEAIRFDFDTKKISNEINIPEKELKIGLWPAVEEFLDSNQNWKLLKRYTHNNGLTILERINNEI